MEACTVNKLGLVNTKVAYLRGCRSRCLWIRSQRLEVWENGRMCDRNCLGLRDWKIGEKTKYGLVSWGRI